MQAHIPHSVWPWLTGISLIATSCSSSNSDSEIEGLAAPESVEIVTPAEEESGSAPGLAASGLFPADSDYNQDDSHVRVYDPSLENLEQVNMILCYVGATAADEMVNEGMYLAQVDVSHCEDVGDDGGGDQGAGQNGAVSDQEVEEFMMFTVNSTRASKSSPGFADVWVDRVDDEEEMGDTIYVDMRVDEGASAENGLGQFTMNWSNETTGVPAASMPMEGNITTTDTDGDVGISFYEAVGDTTQPHTTPGDFSQSTRMSVSVDETSDSGVAKISSTRRSNFGGGDSGEQEEDWLIAFNGTHFKRQVGSDPAVTLSRTDFVSNVFSYNLYHADGENAGQRVELNSGFPIQTDSGLWGYAGYYGVWLPDDAELSDGDSITRVSWDSDMPGEAYTVKVAPGRLIKNTRQQLDLSELDGVSLQYWDNAEQSQFLAEYTTGQFFKTAQFNDETGEWTELGSPVAITTNGTGDWVHFWSQQLGGQVVWVDGDDFVTFFEETQVDGSDPLFLGAVDGSVSFWSVFDCPAAELTAGDVDAGNVYLANPGTLGEAELYRFNESDLTLYHDVDADGLNLDVVGLAPGEEPTGGPYEWGWRSGPLLLQAEFDQLTDIWDAWNADVYYTYETGPNPWNQFVGLNDSTGSPVSFDAPISFLYTHSTANDRNADDSHDGDAFWLQYNGPGQLHGIPFEPQDLDGGDYERWYPVINIEDGVAMGPTGAEYVVKAIEVEQQLAQDESGSAALSLDGASALTLPTSEIYTQPDIGPMPTVTDPPAVINGEVQG